MPSPSREEDSPYPDRYRSDGHPASHEISGIAGQSQEPG